MATTGIRLTLRNVRDGGYILTREMHAGYETSEWRQDHKQAFGWSEQDALLLVARLWLVATMAENVQEQEA